MLDRDFDEDGTAIKTHQPCPDCGSSDALSVYEDHTYCFSCNTRHYTGQKSTVETPKTPSNIEFKGSFRDITDRGILQATCTQFNVKTLANSEGVIRYHYYPYYDKDGNIVAVKKRTVDGKKFEWFGEPKKALLFGQQLWSKGRRFITITEGEIDCLSVSQMIGSQYPVVSVPNGAGSKKAIKDNYEYLDSFENIVLCWDGDEVGRKAVQDIAMLLPLKKVRIIKMPERMKDPNEFLKAGADRAFRNLWYSAEEYRPEDITNIGDTFPRLEDYKKSHVYIPTPWQRLNDMISGTRFGQLVIMASGTGMGKSAFLKSWMYHLLNTTELSIGGLFFEESIEETVISLMSLKAAKNLKKPVVWKEQSPEDIKNWYKAISDARRIELYESLSSDDPDYVLSKIRYLAVAKDCKIIFLDHITYLTDDADNPRIEVNKLVKKLHALSVELGITVIAACHLRKSQSSQSHEEGGRVTLDDLKESSSIKQLADVIIGLERDGQAQDIVKRNTTLLRVLKNRDFGEKGEACALVYDTDTTILEELDPSAYHGDEGGDVDAEVL